MRSDRYQITRLPNGMIRVFDLASKLAGCYHADGTYRHGDLRAPTIGELLGDEERDGCRVARPVEELVIR